MYKLIFEKRALRCISKLEHSIKKRIWKKLHDCKKDPFRIFEKLVETKGFKLRVGDWRVIVDIERGKKTIIVLKVGHRKNIYDK